MTNGEKYKTPEERDKAFNDFCFSHEGCRGCPISSEIRIKTECAYAWEELESTPDKELLPCPFCGGEAILIESSNNNDFASITCRKCSVYTDTLPVKKAIEQWNRRN